VLVNQTIKAIYENGVLRPLTPLALPDHTEVQITVEAASARPDAEAQRRQVDAALLAAGLMLPRPAADPTHRPLTDAERDALARHIPTGRPLSELILEERDGH
jgi:predicted DNA-binding antitoxin AbrB/MazE fold protein